MNNMTFPFGYKQGISLPPVIPAFPLFQSCKITTNRYCPVNSNPVLLQNINGNVVHYLCRYSKKTYAAAYWQSPNSDSGSRGIPRPPCVRLPEPSGSVWETYTIISGTRTNCSVKWSVPSCTLWKPCCRSITAYAART